MEHWPRAYDPAAPITHYERREIVRNGFAEMLPIYRESRAAVRRGKVNTKDETDIHLLNSCDRDLNATIRVIEERAREAFYGEVIELNQSAMTLLNDKELQILRMVRYISIRETAARHGLHHETVLEIIRNASAKVSRARCRQKNPIMWFLTGPQTAVWELVKSDLAAADIAELLELDSPELNKHMNQIRIAQEVLSLVQPVIISSEILIELSVDQRLIYILSKADYRDCQIANIIKKPATTVNNQHARIRKKMDMLYKIPAI